jgi:hypothetical protein
VDVAIEKYITDLQALASRDAVELLNRFKEMRKILVNPAPRGF